MASTTVRPIPTSYYYSGQGRLGLGTRNTSTDEITDLVFVGNVTSLTVDIAITKFEHKESMSGERAVDLTIIQERNATFKFNAESLNLKLLTLGLYGTQSAAAGTTVAAEVHVIGAQGNAIPLGHPHITPGTLVITGTGTAVEGTDYDVDYGFGTLYIKTGGNLLAAESISIAYTYGAYDAIESFTTGTPPERFIRFEGLNTVDGSLRLIDIYRGAFDPLTGLEFINEELGAGEFGGNILPNLLITDPTKSKYFRERRYTPA